MTCSVYIDYKPDGMPFYVGKGAIARVANFDRNPFHTCIRTKYPGWFRKVVETASEALCLEFEQLLIAEIGRRDLGLGPLVNLTDGGEGTLGRCWTDEQRLARGLQFKGRQLPSEWKEKLRKAQLDYFSNNPSARRRLSEGMRASYSRRSEDGQSVHKQRVAKHFSSTKWMTDGTQNRRVPLIEVSNYSELGWRFGQTRNKKPT